MILEKLVEIRAAQELASGRMGRVEAVVCPDIITGQDSIGERMARVESMLAMVVTSAKAGWWTVAKIGAAVTFLTTTVTYGIMQLWQVAKIH